MTCICAGALRRHRFRPQSDGVGSESLRYTSDRPTPPFGAGETRKFQARGDTAFGFLVFVISGTDQADGKPISRI